MSLGGTRTAVPGFVMETLVLFLRIASHRLATAHTLPSVRSVAPGKREGQLITRNEHANITVNPGKSSQELQKLSKFRQLSHTCYVMHLHYFAYS